MLTVGLTGQTGAGKSTVGKVFQSRGIPSVDCDRVAREVVEPGTECLDAIALAFGQGILLPDGSLNRGALGEIVFSDPQALNRLNGLIFPAITSRIQEILAELKAEGTMAVLLDAPTLFESGADALCGKIVAVTAPEPVRLARIMARDGLAEEAALHRMKSQHSETFFRQHADYLIENSGDIALLTARAEEVYHAIYTAVS